MSLRALQQIIEMDSSAVDWDKLFPHLLAYVEAQAAGEPYQAQFPDVAALLDSSVEVASVYARLSELHLAEAQGKLDVPRVPSADLSFLQPKASVWDAVRQIGRTYHLQLTQALTDLLAPPPTLAFAPRSDDEMGTILLQLAEREDAPFTFTLYQNGTLEVEVVPAGRAWPDLAGSRVTIEVGERRETQLTDAWGLVMFEGLGLVEVGKLAILVEPIG